MSILSIIAFLLATASLTSNLDTNKQKVIANQARFAREASAKSIAMPQSIEATLKTDTLASSSNF